MRNVNAELITAFPSGNMTLAIKFLICESHRKRADLGPSGLSCSSGKSTKTGYRLRVLPLASLTWKCWVVQMNLDLV